jgi:hypothetical protein
MATITEIRQQNPQYGDMSDQQLADGLYGKYYSDIPRAEFDAKIGMAPQTTPAPVPAPSGAPPVAQASMAPGPDTAVGRVASRAKEAAGERFGDQPFGISDKTVQELRDKGILAPEGASMTPIWALNELVYRYGSKAGDLALRAIAAGIGGVAGATGQAAEELGASQGMAKRLERDINQLPEAVAPLVGTGPAVPRTPRAPAGAAAPTAAAGETLGPQAVKIAAPGGAAEFKAASQSFYKAADDAGVVVKPESYGGLATDIFQTAAKERLNPTLTPGSTAAVKEIASLADPRVGPVSFQTLDTMRQLAGDARQSAKAGSNDARVAGIIIDKIDDYVANLSVKDVVAGNPKVAADTIVKARDLWSRAAKLDRIEQMVDRAATTAGQFSGSGLENALRTEFRSLAKSKERMKSFSADEQKAIKLAARGGTGGNIARNVGRMAARGPVSAFTSGGTGAMIGSDVLGPGIGTAIGGGTALVAGEIGRKVATVLTQRSIRRLEDMIRQGGDSQMAAAALKRGNNLLANLQAASIAGALPPEEQR